MSILIHVVNQKMHASSTMDGIVAGSQQFVKFRFNLSEEWDGLMTFAQFMQNGVAYNQYLDEENSAYLPSEIGMGTCTLMLYGSHNTTIGTTNYLTLKINENILVSDASSTDISETLYNQLVTRINSLTSWNGQSVSELEAKVSDLSSQLNRKAAQADLVKEITRAKGAENANAAQIALKANQSQVDELELKITELANSEVVANLIEAAVEEEMAAYLASGALANLTIQDGSVTRNKVDQYVGASLDKADTAMQPNVYDPQGFRTDIYSYAQGLADIVAGDLDKVLQEIADAYVLTDTLKYSKLGDAIRGAVTLSRNYAQALLNDYKAYTIEIVDALPEVGASQTFYLIPKDNGNGYDKYWYITDKQGNKTWDVFGGSSMEVVDTLPSVGEPDVDYFLKSSSGYLYYKYIDGVFHAIGSSSSAVSPTATVEQTDTGAKITITDASGTTTAEITNGEKGDKGDPGEKGDPGKDGEDGYTPVKGTDYCTDADKAELVAAVLAALPTYDGETAYSVTSVQVDGEKVQTMCFNGEKVTTILAKS